MAKPVRADFTDGHPGDTPEHWHAKWEGYDFDQGSDRLRQDQDPQARALMAALRPADVILEAGCGSGRVVAFLQELGYRAIGIDFGAETLAAAKSQWPDLPLVCGDVARFPFRDHQFDKVISLGVVEHFQDGPHDALVEHRRILRRDGLLLVSVPRLSPLKRWNDLWKLRLGQRPAYRSSLGLLVTRQDRPGVCEAHHRQQGQGHVFFQYEFDRDAIRREVERAGFEVVSIRPVGVSWGLRHSSPLHWVARRLQQAADSGSPSLASQRAQATGWARPGGGEARSPRNGLLRGRVLARARDLAQYERSRSWLGGAGSTDAAARRRPYALRRGPPATAGACWPVTVVLAGRATSVPLTAVLTSPERITTDNTKAASTCVAPHSQVVTLLELAWEQVVIGKAGAARDLRAAGPSPPSSAPAAPPIQNLTLPDGGPRSF